MTRAGFTGWVALIVLLGVHVVAHAQERVDWTEGPGRLGLGYPVPIPQDTPLPFDGFRSYAGLHARHQQLLLEQPSLSAEVVGTTRLGREIWLYRFGSGATDREGRPRPAILINGGIHAREWQSPEVVTGLMELLALGQDDDHWLSYLRDNVSVLMLPVQNIDGFLQTQRYPRSNYLGSDPSSPAFAPRDGRMRRKNLLGADEDLFTVGDHLNGVDLNRNNAPFWAVTADTALPTGLIYRGPGQASEPETQALQAAAASVPVGRLRFYSDMHSFSQVFFSIRTGDMRRDQIQMHLLDVVSRHHRALPGGVVYANVPEPVDRGIGTTAEYFAHAFQIPSLTWEIEPGSRGGVQYGGFGSNGHDGFILPESQIRRVRENLAQSLAAVAYHMAGPPYLARMRVIDAADSALLLEHQWLPRDGGLGREADHRQLAPLTIARPYRLQLAFNKPMRWRDGAGNVVPFPGRDVADLAIDLRIRAGSSQLAVEWTAPVWLHEVGADRNAPLRYRDDTVQLGFTITDTVANRAALAGIDGVNLTVDLRDMTGQALDANPATAVDWQSGAWARYEDAQGIAGDSGGADSTRVLPATQSMPAARIPVAPGHSAGWHDPARSGEGFMLENIDGQRALVYWFTYDDSGNQRWLTGLGAIEGNRIRFPQLFLTTGGRFGPGFDPSLVQREVVAEGEFWFADCGSGWFDYDGLGQRGRFHLVPTSRTLGVDCESVADPIPARAGQSGSWYDPSHAGEGFTVQWMDADHALVMWFSFDPTGEPYWMVGLGRRQGEELVFEDLHATRGGRFGAAFDPAQVQRFLWGELRLRLGCARGQAQYDSVLPGFGQGSFDLHRLTRLHGLGCTGS